MNKPSKYEILGKSPEFETLLRSLDIASATDVTVILTGESGTGKELLAHHIHKKSRRHDAPFVAINCAALPEGLAESEFFGHIKGAFTGAVSNNPGRISMAEGGTLFLDEVADLPLSMQVKLLRVIQEKLVRPVGATKERRTDVRIVSATHQNLAQRVQDGEFRQDLYYRLNVIELSMPALRERPEDIPDLVEHLLKNIAGNYQQPVPALQDEALAALKNYPFPGNVRELENILERAFALCENEIITLDDLGLLNTPQGNGAETKTRLAGETLEDYLARIERDILLQALKETRWNKTSAAGKLGISFRSFRYRLSKLGIDNKDGDS